MIAAYDTRIDGAMTAARAHYDDLLGPIYGWMVGGFDLAIAAARAELWAVGVAQGDGGTATIWAPVSGRSPLRSPTPATP